MVLNIPLRSPYVPFRSFIYVGLTVGDGHCPLGIWLKGIWTLGLGIQAICFEVTLIKNFNIPNHVELRIRELGITKIAELGSAGLGIAKLWNLGLGNSGSGIADLGLRKL